MRMTFVSNHDKNAWEGTEFEQFGEALEAAIVLSVVGEGMPLIYSGQEAGNDKRLEFFERDPIHWRDHPMGELYRSLFALKHSNSALWNAHWGARMIDVPNSATHAVFSFVRRNEQDKVFAVFNFSGEPQTVTFSEALCQGDYVDYFTGADVDVDAATTMMMDPWAFRVLVRPA
jgi:glycosidase